jgi:L-fucose mutarotase/ribose pyranase (RbsD/FucU family)
VKINNLTNGLVAALLLASPLVGADTQYPAADFKPKVIYQDIDSSSSKPASASVASKVVETAEVDAKFPAADFAPKVLYKDADYKPSKTSQVASDSVSTSNVAESAAVKVEEESMVSFLLGLVVFAVAGYVFLTKREKPKAKTYNTDVHSSHVSGLSGVARYLRKHNMAATTGVARYLESIKGDEPVSGVDKYLERQAKSDRQKAAQGGTGVEKYIRRR